MVLTVQATEIAARAGDRETLGARMEVVNRVFLDGVDGQRTGFTLDFAPEHTVIVASATTDARLAICYMAMVRTEQTLHPSVIQRPIVSALHQNTIAS